MKQMNWTTKRISTVLLMALLSLQTAMAQVISGGTATQTTATGTTTTGTTTTATTTATTVVGAQYYVVKSGDTLGGIATKYHTTVAELMRLNPQVNPTALQPGDQIRVG